MDEKKKKIAFASAEINPKTMEEYGLFKSEDAEGPLSYVIKQATGSASKVNAPRIAFTEDPLVTDHYAGIFKTKKRLLPDHVIKLIRVQNHLIASILRARSNTISMFGRMRPSRFEVGCDIKIRPEFENYLSPDQMVKVRERIERVQRTIIHCGQTEGLKDNEKMSLSDFLYLQTYDGVSLGRFATEIIYEDNDNGESSKIADRARKFHRFRPVDAGTIYRAVRKGESAQGIRSSGIQSLEQLAGHTINIDKMDKDEYAYVQVIDGMPKQAFAPDELIVQNLYPSNDIDHNGYPVTPIDTAISSITTHLSIDAYNRLYFQNGRAAKGILVIKSEDIDQSTVNTLKQEFIASINNVGNSFRVPVFGVGPQDEIDWKPMLSSNGDGEFQFLYDAVARNILSTFNMSPDELPGYGHLSRGTNQQTLSESSNQFKLTAERDTGLRPLILAFESFLNEKIFPIIDPELAQICTVNLSGLDAQSREQESLRLQQDMPIHMTYDEVLNDVDKDPIGDRLGGKIPFNERYQLTADKYLNVSQIMSDFMGSASALSDPLLQYKRDQFWLQNLNVLMQVNPSAIKAYYATKPHAKEILRMLVEDHLEEDLED